MLFNGFEVYPCGNAVLTINNNILTVSEISDSGLDGVLIKVEDTDSYAVNFGTLESISQNNGVLKSASLVRNPYGQVVSLCETFHWYDQQNNNIIVGYNSSLLPSSYSIFGSLNGVDVFDITNANVHGSPTPIFPPPAPLGFAILWPVVVAAIAVGVSIWAALHSKDSITYNKKI
jgi:hypothetical protein